MKIEEQWLQGVIDFVASRGGRMIDVGANVGEWSRALAGSMVSVEAYEPDPRAYAVLASLVSSRNVTPVRKAVGASSGHQRFNVRSGSAQSSLSAKHPFGHGVVVDHFDVEVVTLPEIVGDGADFVKVDIEGGEVDLEYPDTVANYLIECHGTFKQMLPKIPTVYNIHLLKHPHPAAQAQGHCWIFCTKELV